MASESRTLKSIVPVGSAASGVSGDTLARRRWDSRLSGDQSQRRSPRGRVRPSTWFTRHGVQREHGARGRARAVPHPVFVLRLLQRWRGHLPVPLRRGRSSLPRPRAGDGRRGVHRFPRHHAADGRGIRRHHRGQLLARQSGRDRRAPQNGPPAGSSASSRATSASARTSSAHSSSTPSTSSSISPPSPTSASPWPTPTATTTTSPATP